nr:5-deoxy-glucuronate isomerase [Vibrio sinus]
MLSKYPHNSTELVKHEVTPKSAGWNYVGFKLIELTIGESIEISKSSNERCLVLVSGKATISAGSKVFENIGDRMSPFEKTKPFAVYVAPNEPIKVVANTELELAVCEAPGKNNHATRLISPDDIDAEHRGTGQNKRYVHNILPDYKEADSLLVVEVYTDEGCSSSYPSHKHDQDAEPNETYLEETYYHRLNPDQGFCMQRVYTDDRELDECMAVYDKDVVMVPKGYHPVATLAGYDNYYLNVMAGPTRKWLFTWEKDHAWVNSEAYKN